MCCTFQQVCRSWAKLFTALGILCRRLSPFAKPLTCHLRPIIMQLDLQSVEKVPFSTFAWTFAPKILEIGLLRLRMTWSFRQYLSGAVSRFSGGPVAKKITVSAFSIQLSYNPRSDFDPIGICNRVWPGWIEKVLTVKVFFSIRSEMKIVFGKARSKKCWRWFPATGPLEKLETALDRYWRKLLDILMRGIPISNVFGAKGHANVLKVTFSTDCKSNCMILGLRV